MLAQIEGGIGEEERRSQRREKVSEAGLKGLGSHRQSWGGDEVVTKSLGDALFPSLEDALTVNGYLVDISKEISDPSYWSSDELRLGLPPGSLVRITAPGTLFDARYVATTLAGFAAAWTGLMELDESTPIAYRANQPKIKNSAKPPDGSLESAIAEMPPIRSEYGNLDAKKLRAIVKIARGLFAPGLHMNLMPTGDHRLIISSRLQEGRDHLDGDVDVLFARYGVVMQEWTLVGSIGHYAPQAAPSLADPGLADDGVVNRAKMANYINNALGFVGALGISDIPQFPGFSVVPVGVYRTVRSSLAREGRGAVVPAT